MSEQKVTVQLTLWTNQLSKLSKLGAQSRRSVGKVIRDAVDECLDKNLREESPKRHLELVKKD